MTFPMLSKDCKMRLKRQMLTFNNLHCENYVRAQYYKEDLIWNIMSQDTLSDHKRMFKFY